VSNKIILFSVGIYGIFFAGSLLYSLLKKGSKKSAVKKGLEELSLKFEKAVSEIRNEIKLKTQSIEEVKDNRERGWSDETRTFYEKHILPEKDLLERGGYFDPVLRILDLLDKEGGCPSVVSIHEDETQKPFKNRYQQLKEITLRTHSFNVAEKIKELLSRKSGGKTLLGRALLEALSHDIGKIPRYFKDGRYLKGDHPFISAELLKEILPSDLHERKRIINAVRDHHQKNTKDDDTRLLREADSIARSKEGGSPDREEGVVERDKPLNEIESVDLGWLDLKEFLGKLEEKINILKPDNTFEAFTTEDGVVFFYMGSVSDTVYFLAKKKGISLKGVGRREIEMEIRKLLKDFIPDYIGKDYPGAKFEVRDKNGQELFQGYYMPLFINAFQKSLSYYEERKTGILRRVKTAYPLVGMAR